MLPLSDSATDKFPVSEEKLKAQRRVPLNAGDPQEQWWLSQVTNVHSAFDPIVSMWVQSDVVCIVRLEKEAFVSSDQADL